MSQREELEQAINVAGDFVGHLRAQLMLARKRIAKAEADFDDVECDYDRANSRLQNLIEELTDLYEEENIIHFGD